MKYTGIYCYYKLKNGVYYIYEKGTEYVSMRVKTVDRMFKDLNNKPLKFPNERDAFNFCKDRNDIMRMKTSSH